MRPFVPVGILIAAVYFLTAAVKPYGFPASLILERDFPTSHGVELSQLIARDVVRHHHHGRILLKHQSSSIGIVDFPVDGNYDPFTIGLYYTRIQLGSPPKELYVQIDTGSDVLWVSCNPCKGCPEASGLRIQLEFFDPGSSSTASPVSCSDHRCSLRAESLDFGCSVDNNHCSYSFQYGDGSGTSGYYVSDLLHMRTIVGQSVTTNSSAPIVFGCSNSQTGTLTKSARAVDGIFGFGQQDLSVISQLALQGVTPRVFSHCLKGDDKGGGILVLGEIVEPSMVYSPLVPLQSHYNLNLQSISINGKTLDIDPAVFETSSNRGTIIDSGTTLVYLAEEAYDPFISAITASVSQSVIPVLSRGKQCYMITSSVSEVFPPVSLIFAGGASMNLKPEDYLLRQNPVSDNVWCIGFQKNHGQGLTILGDLVLKDKIFVYDLARQRIGWANYDCSMSVNVSTAGKSEFVNARQLNHGNSLQNVPFKLVMLNSAMTFLVLYILIR